MLVVRTTEQADPVRSVKTRSREPVQVIEFQGAGLAAPAPMPVGERAAAAVALEDLAFDGVRNVTRRRFVRVFGRSRSRLPTRGESLLLHLLDEQVECVLDDRRQVSVGDAVTEQILGLPELVMTRATRGELELEGFLGERCNYSPLIASRRWRGWRCERESRGRLGWRHRHGGAERECG